MLIFLLIFLLFSNAITLRRDKSILFSRVVITSFILSSFLAYTNLYLRPLEKGIGIYRGLFHYMVKERFSIVSILTEELLKIWDF